MAGLDEALFLWINGWVGRIPPFDTAMQWVVSDYLVPVCFALTLLGLWFRGEDKADRQRYQTRVIVALVAMALAAWVVQLVNGLYTRPRPFHDLDVSLLFYQPTDSSFPAHSAAAAFAIAITVWRIDKRVGTCLLIMAGLFGFSRVYAGVHYPLDIVGGALIGLAVLPLALKLRDIAQPVLTRFFAVARILCLA